MPYFNRLIYVYGCYPSIVKNWMPQNFIIANFGQGSPLDGKLTYSIEETLPLLSEYFCPKHKDEYIFENHRNQSKSWFSTAC